MKGGDKMTIQYYRKNVFGNERNYLVDTANSRVILGLINQTTISEWQIGQFQKLGLEFEEVLAPRI